MKRNSNAPATSFRPLSRPSTSTKASFSSAFFCAFWIRSA